MTGAMSISPPSKQDKTMMRLMQSVLENIIEITVMKET